MTAPGNPIRSIALAIAWFAVLVTIALVVGTVDTAWRKVAWLPAPGSTDLAPAPLQR